MKIHSLENPKSTTTGVKDEISDTSFLIRQEMLPKSMSDTSLLIRKKMSPKSTHPPPLHPHRRALNPTRRTEPPIRSGSQKRRNLQQWVFSDEVRVGVNPLRSEGLSELPHLASVNLIDVGVIIP